MLPALRESYLPAMADEAVAQVRALESAIAAGPQIDIPITHMLHAGMYARTAHLPTGALITGALIKVPTMLVVHGDTTVFIGGESARLAGYHVLRAAAGRKQAFLAHADTTLTMIFPTSATTVEEAEAEFTDEVDLLQTRRHREN